VRSPLDKYESDAAPTALDDAAGLFVNAGWGEADARFLARACFDALEGLDAGAPDLQTGARLVFVHVAQASVGVPPKEDRDAALLHALAAIIGDAPNPGSAMSEFRLWDGGTVTGVGRPDRERCNTLAGAFREHGCDFEGAIARGWSPGTFGRRGDPAHILHDHAHDPERTAFERHPLIRTMRALVEGGGLDLRRTIDREQVRRDGRWWSHPNPALGRREEPNAFGGFPERLSDPVAWMLVLGPSAIEVLLDDLRSASDEIEAAGFAGGVRLSLERWGASVLSWSLMNPKSFADKATAARPWLDEIERWHERAGAQAHSPLRELWLWFAWEIIQSHRPAWEELGVERQRRILAAANEELAKLRPMLAEATIAPDAETRKQIVASARSGKVNPPHWLRFEHMRMHVFVCLSLLTIEGGVWKGMKPLLLAVRRMGCPCVASDLRYWSEEYPRRTRIENDALAQPPEPWDWLPRTLVNLFHQHVGYEQKHDELLLGLRGNFAQFCLDRLGYCPPDKKEKRDEADDPLPGDTEMEEPSEIWREAYVRAVTALHINPKGKGDRILKRVAKEDPSSAVKRSAHDAWQGLRRGTRLPTNKSPRRAVLEAFWWLRIAHLEELKRKYEANPSLPGALEIEIDHDGAQRTKAKELDRTQEARP
jgi:hypothetical protein